MPSPKVREITITIRFDVPLQTDLSDLQYEAESAAREIADVHQAQRKVEPDVQVAASEPFTPLYLDTSKVHPNRFYESRPEEEPEVILDRTPGVKPPQVS